MSAPLNYQPAHLARPLLPVAWHARTRNFLEDVDTASALFCPEIKVLVVEQADGVLLLSAAMPADVDDDTHDLVSAMCGRGMDATAFDCVVCGEIGPVFQRLNSSLFQRLCCEEHCMMDPILVQKNLMSKLRSPWRTRPKFTAMERMLSSDCAARAATNLATRYDSPRLRQIIAEANALRARISVAQIADSPKSQLSTGGE